MRWDGSVYYVLGTSLAEGTGYRLLNEPGNIQANQYPPLLPAIIAVHQKLVQSSDAFVVGPWLKLSWVLLSACVITGGYLVFRRFLSPGWARCAAIVHLVSLPAYLHFNMLSAELPFAVALVVFLLARSARQSRGREAIQTVALLSAFLARTIGVVFFAAWIGEAVLQRRFRRAGVRLAVAIACVAPWYIWIQHVEQSDQYRQPAYAYQRAGYLYYNVSYSQNIRYIDPYRPELGIASGTDWLWRFTNNIYGLPSVLGETVSSYRSFWVGQTAAMNARMGVRFISPGVVDTLLVGLGAITIYGMILLMIRREWFIALGIAGSITAISTTPWLQQHVRYFSTFLPLLLIAFFTALSAAYAALRTRRTLASKVAALLTVSIAGVVVVEQSITYAQAHTRYLLSSSVTDRSGTPVVYKQLFYYPENVGVDECITWIARHASSGDIVAASMAHWVYIRTGLKAVMPPLELDGANATRMLDSVPARYVILETPSFYTFRYIANAVGARPSDWRRVYSATSSDVHVYERTGVR